MTTVETQEKLESLNNDLKKLNLMKEIHESTDNLVGGYSSEMMEMLNEQIQFIEDCITNLQK